MLPVVSEETCKQLLQMLEAEDSNSSWQKQLIQHLKTENPEINTLILQLANESKDAKKVILVGLLVYKALEMAAEEEEQEEIYLTSK